MPLSTAVPSLPLTGFPESAGSQEWSGFSRKCSSVPEASRMCRGMPEILRPVSRSETVTTACSFQFSNPATAG